MDEDYDKAVTYCAMAILRQEIDKADELPAQQHDRLYDDAYRKCRQALGALMEH